MEASTNRTQGQVMSMRIREGVAADLDHLVAATLNCAMETENIDLGRETATKGVSTILFNPSRGTYYVVEAEETGEFMGCCWVMKGWFSDWRAKEYWLLETIYILPAHRRRGVTTAIIDHLMALVNSNEDVAQLRLVVEQKNDKALNCYTKVGFKKLNYDIMYISRNDPPSQ